MTKRKEVGLFSKSRGALSMLFLSETDPREYGKELEPVFYEE